MDINYLYKSIIEMLPAERKKDDFREDLKDILSKYFSLVNDLDVLPFQNAEKKKDILKIIDLEIKTFENVVKLYYEGLHGEAFQCFQKEMNEHIFKSIGSHHIGNNNEDTNQAEVLSDNNKIILYRARKRTSVSKQYSIKEMFHIPLNIRGIVRNERYSVSGFPCLYLGVSVYDCWKEINRPKLEKTAFLGYIVKSNFQVYDLRKPKKSDFDRDNIIKTLIRIPLILACSIKVGKKNDIFKPEYIIPQLLIETMVSNNNKALNQGEKKSVQIWGIIYSSMHDNKSSSKRSRDVMQNIVLPVIDSNSSETYCTYLASLFKFLGPISPNEAQNKSCNNIKDKCLLIEQLIKAQDPNVLPHLTTDQIVVCLSADGKAQSINIISNAPGWKIS